MTPTSITAIIEGHTVHLPPEVDWPDGLLVRLEPAEEELPTLAEIMKDWRGIATDMPSDLAENHDHYIHGTPKKKT